MPVHKRVSAKKVERAVVQCLMDVLALGFTTVAAVLLHLNLATAILLYLIVILLLARIGDFVPSVVVSIIAALLLAYIAPPDYSFRVDDPLDMVAVVVLLITSLIIARLV